VTNDELASGFELAPEQVVLLEPEELETIEVAR
jgi:non-homologous end joining protein Ku